MCKIEIRPGTIEDLDAIVELFADTIRNVNSRDYTQQEIEVWASNSKNVNSWRNKINTQTFFVAKSKSTFVGFSSIDPDGYLDYMFVHKDFQRRGIANSLLAKIQDTALIQSNSEIYAFVSTTAKQFFERNGFKSVGKKFTTIDGVEFASEKMIKSMTALSN